MRVWRWRAGAFRLLAGLGLLVATRLPALATQAEIVGIKRVYLRAGPGTDQAVIATLRAGDAVNVLDGEGSWTKVETQDGQVGFVYHRYVASKTAGPNGEPTTPPSGAAGSRAAYGGNAPRTAPVAAAAGISVATPAAPPAVPTAASGDEIAAGVAGLRAEIADLKQKIQDRSSDLAADRSAAPEALATQVEAPPPTNPGSSREQSAGVFAVALLSLLVGWVLGSAFTRRRSRSQRSRLRF